MTLTERLGPAPHRHRGRRRNSEIGAAQITLFCFLLWSFNPSEPAGSELHLLPLMLRTHQTFLKEPGSAQVRSGLKWIHRLRHRLEGV